MKPEQNPRNRPHNNQRTTLLAIGLPLLVAVVYLGFLFKPWARPPAPTRRLTAEESATMWDDCKSLFRQGKYQDALQDALRLHETYPGNHIYIEMVADIYDRLGRYSEEAEYWEQYFDRAPNPVTACPQIGQAYWKQGKEKEAISAFERCLARDPENSDSIFFLAHALELAGQTDRSGELYQRGLKIAPQYTDIQLGLARIDLRQDKVAQAKDLALRALHKSPENVDALLVAGLVYSRAGDLPRAKQYLEQGVKLADGYLDFHFALARIAEEENNLPEAIRHYDRILKDQPDNQTARSRREALAGKQ
ncbi:MAG TPA: tetratricopeptide repeat protein [Candidatus Angelobacter sp.]